MAHLKRQKSTTKLPIPRKGTTFIARPRSNLNSSVSVVSAVRDILKIARNTKEVKKMIQEKSLALNGKIIKDHRASISLFNILKADKTYFLTILPSKKFSLQLSKDPNSRVCKIINKKLLKKNKIQINCHDGTNIISEEKITVGDSIYLDFSGKIKKHLPLEKEKKVFIFSGKYAGQNAIIKNKKDKKVSLKIENKDLDTLLNQNQVIVL